MPHDVIMPALGMTQDSGTIVAWRKSDGDPVEEGEILFEVETDKAVMEIASEHSGFLTSVLYAKGAEVPVGDVLAQIADELPGSQEKPVHEPTFSEDVAPTPPRDADRPQEENAKPLPVTPDMVASGHKGRILASPKARRLAAERGLDLSLLVSAGIPQPFHVADLDKLEQLANTSTGVLRLTERVGIRAFAEFMDWVHGKIETDYLAVWSCWGAASLRSSGVTHGEITVLSDVHSSGPPRYFIDPDRLPLSRIHPGSRAQPTLIIRDMTGTGPGKQGSGTGATPVLGVAANGTDYLLVLDYAPDRMNARTARSLLDGFAARMKDPLHHLL